MFLRFICLMISLIVFSVSAKPANIPAFPGAEGFGAKATGGRGGNVIYVTNLNASGAGSFDSAVRTPGPAYILFKVSGLINSTARIRYGQKTIAGQTSPNGIIVRGLHFSEDDNAPSGNTVIRHIRSRYADDNLRVLNTRDVIVDHCSFAWADDECIQISNTTNLTVQNCILGETHGEHARYGGMLIVYGNDQYPLDSISVHHNAFVRLGGRLPEFNCYDNNWCQAHNFKADFTNNLFWDPGAAMEFQSAGGPNGELKFSFNLNLRNNSYVTRNGFPYGMSFSYILENSNSKLYIKGNKMNLYPSYSDYDLINCCSDFAHNVPSDATGPAQKLTSEHSFPFPISTILPTEQLQQYLAKNCGKFPRDSIDRRYTKYIESKTVIDTTTSRENSLNFNDAMIIDSKTANMPIDSDGDGMPDYWEDWNGLDMSKQDHNGLQLSGYYYPGYDSCYTNLEVYLNMLSDSLINGTSTVKGESRGHLQTKVKLQNKVFNRLNDSESLAKSVMFSITGRKVSSAVKVDAKKNSVSEKGVYIIKSNQAVHSIIVLND